MKRIGAGVVFLLTLLPTGGNANPFWSAIATSCVPDSVSIQANRYQTLSDNIIRHQTGNLDPIVLICGVSPNPGGTAPNVVSLTNEDSTGTNARARVKADLIRVARTNGARAVVATVVSGSSANVVVTRKLSPTFAHAPNFSIYYYYVRIELDRTLATENVRSYGVALERAP